MIKLSFLIKLIVSFLQKLAVTKNKHTTGIYIWRASNSLKCNLNETNYKLSHAGDHDYNSPII